jgi:hypothetical protein
MAPSPATPDEVMPLSCVPIPTKGTFSVRLRTAFFAAASALALAAAPVAANAAVARPLTTCSYNMVTVQDNSTAIKVDIVPQCAGEAPAPYPTIWEWVPISSGAQGIQYTKTSEPNNVVLLTYVCPGSAPNTFQVIANEIGTTPNEEFISDDCGTFTEP